MASASKMAAKATDRLWQAHSVVELVIERIGDETDDGGPAIKPALRAVAEMLFASISILEPICATSGTEVNRD